HQRAARLAGQRCRGQNHGWLRAPDSLLHVFAGHRGAGRGHFPEAAFAAASARPHHQPLPDDAAWH
nr:hypothetical protein [Tanacetum cinerariifolium]